MVTAYVRQQLKSWFPSSGMACFYCGVDSTPILLFLIGLIGSLVLATLCFGIGLYAKGTFKNSEDNKNDVFHAEQRV